MAMRFISVLFVLVLLGSQSVWAAVDVKAARGSTTFVVTNVDFENYILDGQPDPDLFLIRGQTYQFDLQGVSALHPFFIKTIQSTGTGNTFDDGVSGNGATGEDDITFIVPMSAPDQLFYNCRNHAAMTGNIFISDPPSLFADGFE